MKTAQVNRRIQDFLRDLADDGTFRMRKKTGHPVCVASYGGQVEVLCPLLDPWKELPEVCGLEPESVRAVSPFGGRTKVLST